MSDVPLLLALTAGAVAAVNPCGFALLPAYLALLVAGDGHTDPDGAGRGAAVRRAVTATVAMTGGFVAVFAVFGLLLTPFAVVVQEHLPWFTVALGLLLAGVSGWLLTGRELPALRLPGRSGRTGWPVTRSWASMFGYGVAYALASLSCTVGPFLAIVVSSLRAGSIPAGVALFVAYAAGMGLVVGVAAVAVAVARTSVVRWLRRVGPLVSRAAGALLLVTGAYVAYYGWYELRPPSGTTGNDPVLEAGGAVQRWLATAIQDATVPALAVLFAALLTGGLLATRARRRRHVAAADPGRSL